MKTKIFYQLDISALLPDNWEGRVWSSKLYSTEESCLKGCLTNEFAEIARFVAMYYSEDFTEEVFTNTRIWLKDDKMTWYRKPENDDENPLQWQVRSHNLVEEEIEC